MQLRYLFINITKIKKLQTSEFVISDISDKIVTIFLLTLININKPNKMIFINKEFNIN